MHSKLENEYCKREQEQVSNDPKTIPKPSRDEMMRMLYESQVSLEKDYAKESKSLWVTNALDGREDYLVSERVYKLVGTRTIDFRNQLMKTASPKNLKQLRKMITPPKGVTQKDAEGSTAPVDEGDEIFDCEDEEIKTETIEEDISRSDKENEMPQATSQATANEENATTEDSSPSKSDQSIPKLAASCPKDKTELLNDAKFIDEMGQLLLTSTISTRISPSIRGIQWLYIKARCNVKERIRLAKSTNEQACIEDESSDNDNSKASEIIDDANDDIGNIFHLVKNC